MTVTPFAESVVPLLTVLTPLVAVPLTVITFYLRSLRDQQVSWHGELVHRMESVEATVGDLRRTIDEFERDYATKEEWLRECMLARRTLEQLGGSMARLSAERHVVNWFPQARPEGRSIADGITEPERNPAREQASDVSTGRFGKQGKDGK